MLTKEVTYVAFDDITPVKGDGPVGTLVADIVAKGLMVPLDLNNGEVVNGTRRYLAIATIKETMPETFQSIFNGGIPVLAHTDLTDFEIIELRMGLSN